MVTRIISSFLFALFYLVALTSCSDDETKDEVTTIKMFISEKTGEYKPWGSPNPVECMFIKEEYDREYFPCSFYEIEGFEHEKGYFYELSVEKTTLANPPADAGNVRYKLIKVLARTNCFYALEYRFAIDADQKEMIELDLQNNLPVPANGGYLIHNKNISIVDENKTIIGSRIVCNV